MLGFFFFFSSRRRHTRYWRDWSSDVCSSDLTSRSRPAGSCPRETTTTPLREQPSAALAGTSWAPSTGFEIGRASCRERVEISVVAVSLKKKKHTHLQTNIFNISTHTNLAT